MIRKFCSLKEAADRLDATEDQIETLLRKGMLREFRDGTHRLLRTADIGAIVAARNRRFERHGQPRARAQAATLPSASDNKSPAKPVPGRVPAATVRLPRSAAAASPSARHGPSRPRITQENAGRTMDSPVPARRRGSIRSPDSPRLSDPPQARSRRVDCAIQNQRQTLSLREWFWTGLIQDNPAVIVLLCGLVLLVVSALVAGACMLTETL